jgi:hypothetical protein
MHPANLKHLNMLAASAMCYVCQYAMHLRCMHACKSARVHIPVCPSYSMSICPVATLLQAGGGLYNTINTHITHP